MSVSSDDDERSEAAAEVEDDEEQPEFYDAEEDERNEEWVATQLGGSGRGRGRRRRTDAHLSCPACFSVLCTDCQRHEVYATQFRAMFVTPSCRVNRDQLLQFPSSSQREEQQQQSSAGDRFHPVNCVLCGTEVGVFCADDEVFHFFNVVASHG